MALDFNPASAGPIFASRSRINTDSKDFGTFTASSQQALLDRIVDGDPESPWFSAGSVSTETIEVTVQDKTVKIAKPINFMVLQNINWKRFKVEWKAGAGAFAIIPGFDFTAIDNADTDIALDFGEISPDTYKFTITSTTDADLKKFGGVYACLSTLQLSSSLGGMDKLDENFRETVNETTLGDGSKSRELILRSGVSYEHWGASIGLDLVTRVEKNLLRGVKRSGLPFTFFPEPGDVNRDVFTAQMKSRWKAKYKSTNKGAGYTIPMVLEELGRL